MKKPKVGERYYYVPYDMRFMSSEGYVEVKGVGRKHFSTTTHYGNERKFKVDSFVEYCGEYSSEGCLYDDKESYLKHVDVMEKSKQLTNSMIYLLDDDDLLDVYEYVRKKLV